MPENVTLSVQGVLAMLRWADLLDVLVVSVFAYMVINWFRRAQSRLVMTGFAMLVGLYFIAGMLKMTLTLFVYQVGITVAAVALVVVFQEEIRRVFERLALARPLARFRSRPLTNRTTDTLVAAAFELARSRTGALIVLKGKEPLDRHVTGGVALNGLLSEPLICSIFDASSAGHDGALVIEAGLATRFAAHLPLSQQVRGDARFGTRHTAALGLSERSDALTVVVSEERGEVSVAHEGKLERVLEPAELAARLTAFEADTAPAQPVGFARGILFRNLGTKAMSVAIASAAWLLVQGYDSQIVARTYEVPLVLRGVPEELFVDPPNPSEVRVTLSGAQRAMRDIDPRELVVAVDLKDATPGHYQRSLTRRDVERPEGVTVQRVTPEEVALVVRPTTIVEVPVKVVTSGTVAPGFVVTGAAARPSTVRLLVARGSTPVHLVKTDPVDVEGRKHSFSLTRTLIIQGRARTPRGVPPMVSVQVQIGPK